jgi:hypothetical protein
MSYNCASVAYGVTRLDQHRNTQERTHIPNGPFLSGFPTTILLACLISIMRATCLPNQPSCLVHSSNISDSLKISNLLIKQLAWFNLRSQYPHYHVLKRRQVAVSFSLPRSQTSSGPNILLTITFSDTFRSQYPSHYHVLRHFQVPISFSLPRSQAPSGPSILLSRSQAPSGPSILLTTTLSHTLSSQHSSNYHTLRHFSLCPSLNDATRFTLIQNYSNFVLLLLQSSHIYRRPKYQSNVTPTLHELEGNFVRFLEILTVLYRT